VKTAENTAVFMPERDALLASADGERFVDNELFSDLTESECNYRTSTPFKALDGSAAELYYMATSLSTGVPGTTSMSATRMMTTFTVA
jgi:hypothetical protein